MKPKPYLDALGIPTPSPEDFRKYASLISETTQEIHRRFGAPDRITNQEADSIIYLAFLLSPFDEWKSKFSRAVKTAIKFYTNPDTLYKTIALAVYSPKVGEAYKKLNPSFDPEKYLTKTTTRPATQKASPQPTSTPSIGAILKKVISNIPKRRFPTVTEYILFHAPSKSYELTYSTTLSCTKNKKSAKGRKVYPYGQAYIAKLTGLSLRTVKRAWSWLRKRGIFNKARNENPKEHHCSLWYLCTSMKQVSYFRDPKNLHRKSKRQD